MLRRRLVHLGLCGWRSGVVGESWGRVSGVMVGGRRWKSGFSVRDGQFVDLEGYSGEGSNEKSRLVSLYRSMCALPAGKEGVEGFVEGSRPEGVDPSVDPLELSVEDLRGRLGLPANWEQMVSFGEENASYMRIFGGMDADPLEEGSFAAARESKRVGRGAVVAGSAAEVRELAEGGRRMEEAQARASFLRRRVRERSDRPGGQDVLPSWAWEDAGLPTPPPELGAKEDFEYALEAAFDAEHEADGPLGGMERGAFGTNLNTVPESVVKEIAEPFTWIDSDDEKETYRSTSTSSTTSSSTSSATVNPHLLPADQAVEAERKQLRRLLLDPIAIPNVPIQNLQVCLAHVGSVHQVVRGGMEETAKALVLVGNRRGGIGYGVGRHKQADRAVELAISAAERDMIFISTYRGQLYHDLVGKKNRVKVIVESRPPAYDTPRMHWIIETALELAGIRHAMATVVGPKRRTTYTIVQALFEAFKQYQPYDASARMRGRRIVHVSDDRLGPQAIKQTAAKYQHWVREAVAKHSPTPTADQVLKK